MSTQETTSTQDALALLELDDIDCFRIAGGEKELIAQGKLRVYKLQEDADVVFLSIGEDYNFPLLSMVPSMRTDTHDFVFPLPGGLYYAVRLPTSVSDDQCEAFVDILALYTTLADTTGTPVLAEPSEDESDQQTQTQEGKKELGGDDDDDDVQELDHTTQVDLSTTTDADDTQAQQQPSSSNNSSSASAMVASGIEKTGEMVGAGLVYGATKMGSALKWGSLFLQSKTAASGEGEGREISEKTKQRIHRAKQMTGVGVSVSSTLVKGVLAMSGAMATSLAASFKQTDLGSRITQSDSKAKTAAKDITVASINAFESLMVGMETAGMILVKDTASATTEFAHHRYGEEAGVTTREAMDVMENMAGMALNANQLRVSRVAKQTLKDTTVKVLREGELVDEPVQVDPSLQLAGKMLMAKAEMDSKK